jgi:isovaleryl-CoA dehydrogenase
VLSQAARGGKGSPGHRLAAQALLFAAEACEAAADSAVQIHGGNGFSEEFEVNRIYRDARLGTLGAGTSEIRRLIIARELLARPSATAG